MPAYFDALLRYFEFSGRSTRRQFWMFQLTALFVCFVAAFLDMAAAGRSTDPLRPGFFLAFAVIFHLLPQVTVTVRRLHDSGRSGWWYWLNFVPFGGLVILAWTGFSPSEPGENAYGPEEVTPAFRAVPAPDYERALRRPGSGHASVAATPNAPQRFI
jgi:uncharacterized membrane protein YhaH (DUF805 family)